MKDPAMLLFGSEFYEDEHVLLMTLEQQGTYLRLIWLAWRNGGLPDDTAKLSKMLGVTKGRFEKSLWPAIEPCWTKDGDRLTQKRQEVERAFREGEPGTGGAGADRPKDPKMSALAKKRWDKRRNAESHAEVDAPAYAGRNAEPQCDAASPPRPPSGTSEANNPNAHDAQPHANAHAEGANADAEGGGAVPVVQLQKALLKTPLRSKLPAFKRGEALMKMAEGLILQSLTPSDIEELDALDARNAQAKNKERGALLATWVDRKQCRAVLDEQKSKKKEAGLKRVASDDAPGADPKAAASVVDDVVKGARAGA